MVVAKTLNESKQTEAVSSKTWIVVSWKDGENMVKCSKEVEKSILEAQRLDKNIKGICLAFSEIQAVHYLKLANPRVTREGIVRALEFCVNDWEPF